MPYTLDESQSVADIMGWDKTKPASRMKLTPSADKTDPKFSERRKLMTSKSSVSVRLAGKQKAT